MRFFCLSLFVFFSISTQAQYAGSGDSDPQALALLESISQQHQNSGPHLIEFSLDIELPGQATETQRGQLIQDGEKFVLDLDQRQIISDNETVWLFLKDMNEVQINDADFDDASDFMSPSDLYQLHKSDDYVFALANEFAEDGQTVTQIECKPLDDNSDYSKLRLTILKKANKVKRMKIFSKDGSRFTMNITSQTASYQTNDNMFSFDAAVHEGVHVEDLRF